MREATSNRTSIWNRVECMDASEFSSPSGDSVYDVVSFNRFERRLHCVRNLCESQEQQIRPGRAPRARKWTMFRVCRPTSVSIHTHSDKFNEVAKPMYSQHGKPPTKQSRKERHEEITRICCSMFKYAGRT